MQAPWARKDETLLQECHIVVLESSHYIKHMKTKQFLKSFDCSPRQNTIISLFSLCLIENMPFGILL